jgi:hypothetical protein
LSPFVLAPVVPEDFPPGFADPGIGAALLFDLEYGQIFDAGIQWYGEFFASLDYGWELLNRPLVLLDGVPGRVRVVARFANAVQLRWEAK